VRTQLALARVARERGDFGAARARLGDAKAGASAFGPDAPEAARIELEEAWLGLDEGDSGEAAARFEHAERGARRALGELDPAVGWALAGRGEALRRSGDRAGARAALDDALALFAGAASADHVRPGEPLGVLAALTSLGALLREQGDLEGAREALLAASAIGARELGADHPRFAATLAELSRVELARGDREAAARAATRAVEISRARLPEGHATRRAADAALAELGPRPGF